MRIGNECVVRDSRTMDDPCQATILDLVACLSEGHRFVSEEQIKAFPCHGYRYEHNILRCGQCGHREMRRLFGQDGVFFVDHSTDEGKGWWKDAFHRWAVVLDAEEGWACDDLRDAFCGSHGHSWAPPNPADNTWYTHHRCFTCGEEQCRVVGVGRKRRPRRGGTRPWCRQCRELRRTLKHELNIPSGVSPRSVSLFVGNER